MVFKEPHWSSSVEYFYHHWFTSDSEMMSLFDELGVRDRVIVKRPLTVVYYKDTFYPLDSPINALKFPGFTLWDIARFGFVTVYLRYLAGWKPLESVLADDWMRKYYGERLYAMNFESLLQGKFGEHYKEVNMAWFWARMKARSTRLATFEGGFQAFSDLFAERLRQKGVNIRLETPVSAITPTPDQKLEVQTGQGAEIFDRCLVTLAPALMAKMAPSLPEDYLKGLLALKNMGAVVMVISMRRTLSDKGYYWFNMPKTAGFPFLALVEHTNFVPPEKFGGDHILYCGDYLDLDHEYFTLTKEELLERFLPALKRVNPEFEASWVKDSWLFRTDYAQPIPLLDHSKNIPDIKTPVPGLFFASMSQVYPWDRGTNFAVQIGRKAARMMLE